MQSGDPVLLRSIYGGRVRWTFPHRYVGRHDDGRIGLYCGPGNAGKLMKRALQAPLEIDGTRFDTTDWALDVVVDPDGTWRWEDWRPPPAWTPLALPRDWYVV